MNKVEKVYNEFWKQLVEVDGVVDMEQVKKELYDYSIMLDEVPKVYCHITGNQISKPLTAAEVVIQVADEHYDDICNEYFEDERTYKHGRCEYCGGELYKYRTVGVIMPDGREIKSSTGLECLDCGKRADY